MSNNKNQKKKSSKKQNNKQKKSMGSKQSVDRMKYEIASELGVNLGPDSTSRANGKVGGEITRRLVQNGMNKLGTSNNKNQNK